MSSRAGTGIRRLIQRGAMVLPLAFVPAATAAAPGAASEPGDAVQGLAEARRATAPFHELEAAQAAGWATDVTGCLDFPDGYEQFGPGAMGHHYLNVGNYLDGGELDPAEPEALLYETQPDGSMRLTAVEYIVPSADRPKTAPPPVIFGREMMFHDQFDAWALHVWLWLPNEYGLYADVNPDVGCEFAHG